MGWKRDGGRPGPVFLVSLVPGNGSGCLFLLWGPVLGRGDSFACSCFVTWSSLARTWRGMQAPADFSSRWLRQQVGTVLVLPIIVVQSSIWARTWFGARRRLQSRSSDGGWRSRDFTSRPWATTIQAGLRQSGEQDTRSNLAVFDLFPLVVAQRGESGSPLW